MIREMTGSNTQHITRVINQMKKYYFNMLQEFSADGKVDTSNTGSILRKRQQGFIRHRLVLYLR